MLYPVVHTRPDVAYAASTLGQALANPSPHHLEAANRAIQFLDGAKARCLLFDREHQGSELEIFTDALFGNNRTDWKSSQGYLIKLFGTLVI